MKDLAVKVRNLYIKEQLSGVEIARKLNLNIRWIYRIMERNGIERRKSSESNGIKFLKEKPTFKIKKKLNNDDLILLASGTMLYWAEGAKYKDKNILDFANSDPVMIKVFLKFFRQICGIKEKKISIYLYCYSNQNIEELKSFWSKMTKVPLSQFTKPYVRDDFREDKIGKMPYGLVHVRYCDKKLYIQIEEWHKLILKKLGVWWSSQSQQTVVMK